MCMSTVYIFDGRPVHYFLALGFLNDVTSCLNLHYNVTDAIIMYNNNIILVMHYVHHHQELPMHFIEVTLAHSFALSLLAVTVVVTTASFQFHTVHVSFLKKPFSVNYPMHYACMAQNHMGYLIVMEYYNYRMVAAVLFHSNIVPMNTWAKYSIYRKQTL